MADAAAAVRRHSGIHLVGRTPAVMLLRSGSSFRVACSECCLTIARNVGMDEVASQAALIGRHRKHCTGPRRPWMRRMIRLFAVS
jgi:hypothetical protein